MGTALLTAAGGVSEAQYRAALDTEATLPGLKAPAQGLLLWEVLYPVGKDPFPEPERALPPGLPRSPPFFGDASTEAA